MYVVKNVDVNLVTLPLWFLLGVKVWNDKLDFNPIAGTCVFNVFISDNILYITVLRYLKKLERIN